MGADATLLAVAEDLEDVHALHRLRRLARRRRLHVGRRQHDAAMCARAGARWIPLLGSVVGRERRSWRRSDRDEMGVGGGDGAANNALSVWIEPFVDPNGTDGLQVGCAAAVPPVLWLWALLGRWPIKSNLGAHKQVPDYKTERGEHYDWG